MCTSLWAQILLLQLFAVHDTLAFEVLWNSPWPSCCGFKAEKQLLPKADPVPQFAEFNISVNVRDGRHGSTCNGTIINPCFNGPRVVTIYTELTGLYPSFRTDPVTHERVAINGGLPQLVNLTAHLEL